MAGKKLWPLKVWGKISRENTKQTLERPRLHFLTSVHLAPHNSHRAHVFWATKPGLAASGQEKTWPGQNVEKISKHKSLSILIFFGRGTPHTRGVDVSKELEQKNANFSVGVGLMKNQLGRPKINFESRGTLAFYCVMQRSPCTDVFVAQQQQSCCCV